MIELNILPWRETEAVRAKKLLLNSLVLYTILACLILCLSYLILYRVDAFYRDRLIYVNSRVSQLKAETKKYNKIVALRKKALYILKVIQQVNEDRYLPIKLLNAFGTIMPKQVSLTSLKLNAKQEVVFKGSSRVSNNIIHFEKNIVNSGLFSQASIVQVSLKQQKEGDLYYFTINAKLKPRESD